MLHGDISPDTQPKIKVLVLFPLRYFASPYLACCPSSGFTIPIITSATDNTPFGSAPHSENNFDSFCFNMNLSSSLHTIHPSNTITSYFSLV